MDLAIFTLYGEFYKHLKFMRVSISEELPALTCNLDKRDLGIAGSKPSTLAISKNLTSESLVCKLENAP
jgi:hypothetical protein